MESARKTEPVRTPRKPARHALVTLVSLFLVLIAHTSAQASDGSSGSDPASRGCARADLLCQDGDGSQTGHTCEPRRFGLCSCADSPCNGRRQVLTLGYSPQQHGPPGFLSFVADGRS